MWGLGGDLLRGALDALGIGIFVLDPSLRVVLVNSKAENLFGIRREEVLGRDKRELIREKIKYLFSEPHSFEASVLSIYQKMDSTEGLLCSMVNKNMWLEFRSHPIDKGPWTGGRVDCYSDVTSLVMKVEAYRRSEELYRVLVETGPEGVYILDFEGRFLWVNEALLEKLGYTREEMLGLRATDLIASEFHLLFKERLERLKRGEVLRDAAEYKIVTKGGRELWVEVVSAPVRGEKGINHFIAIVRDVSERKALEIQLRQAQKLGAIGTLAGGIAHDFNNVLTGILGFAQLALSYIGSDHPLRGHLEAIEKSAFRATDLVGRLLAFSSRKILEIRPVDVNQEVRHLVFFIERIIGEDIQLELCLAEGPTLVLADPSALEQILINLVTNARDAMPRGGSLVIETERVYVDGDFFSGCPEARPGEYVVVRVRDTGVGIPAELLPGIFEPFFTTKSPEKGTGLGLSMVQGLVRQHGGFVRVMSQKGVGSTFEVYFPESKDREEEFSLPVEMKESRGKGEVVLVVEDDPGVRGFMERALAAGGYEVLVASSGREALERVREWKGSVDLVITDMVLPDVRGREVVELLLQEVPDFKVLFISGYSVDLFREKGFEGGRGEFLAKPFSMVELLYRVRSLLDR